MRKIPKQYHCNAERAKVLRVDSSSTRAHIEVATLSSKKARQASKREADAHCRGKFPIRSPCRICTRGKVGEVGRYAQHCAGSYQTAFHAVANWQRCTISIYTFSPAKKRRHTRNARGKNATTAAARALALWKSSSELVLCPAARSRATRRRRVCVFIHNSVCSSTQYLRSHLLGAATYQPLQANQMIDVTILVPNQADAPTARTIEVNDDIHKIYAPGPPGGHIPSSHAHLHRCGPHPRAHHQSTSSLVATIHSKTTWTVHISRWPPHLRRMLPSSPYRIISRRLVDSDV